LAAAVLALAAGVVPVTAFFAAPRLAVEVVFFSTEGFLPAYVFFTGASLFFEGAGTFFAGAFLAAVAGFAAGLADLAVAAFFGAAAVRPLDFAVVALAAAGFFAVIGLALAALVVVALVAFGLAAVFVTLAAGLFSFAAEVSVALVALGGSFTRPEGPLGSTKVPFSAPTAIALLS